MSKLSKTGLIVVFSFILIIVSVISSVIGVRTVNNIKEINAELVKNNETLKVENETFRNKITELEKENLILKEQTTEFSKFRDVWKDQAMERSRVEGADVTFKFMTNFKRFIIDLCKGYV